MARHATRSAALTRWKAAMATSFLWKGMTPHKASGSGLRKSAALRKSI